MGKKAGLVSELTAAGFSASCCLIHDFPFLWKKSLPGQAFPSQLLPWLGHSVLFVVLYMAMENFRNKLPLLSKKCAICTSNHCFPVLEVFFELCMEKVLKARNQQWLGRDGAELGGDRAEVCRGAAGRGVCYCTGLGSMVFYIYSYIE